VHPVMFQFGETALHGYGVMGATGFLLACAVILTRARRDGLSRERVADVIFWTSLAALVGSRLLFLLQNPEHLQSFGDVVNLRKGGLVFYGAFIAGIPTASLLLLKYNLPFFKSWDIFATGMPLAHGVSRIGCLLAGCCYGVPTDLPWAVTFTDPLSSGPRDVALHPTQIYEALALFGIAAICNLYFARRRADGQVMLLYLVLYAIARSIIEEFRGDADRGFLLGGLLSFSQGVSIVLAVVAIVLFALVPRWLKATPAVPTEGAS
jgi:phosphatidylglycerol---prolipoprotein diacylglyceryl transferase